MGNPFSIRSEIGIRKRVFFVLIITLVPFLLLETFVFLRWFQARREMEMQANLELARAVAKNFETFLQGLVRDELAVGMVLTASRPFPDQERDRMLDRLQADNPAVRSIFWLNSDGRVIASSLRSYIGFNFNDRSYFRNVIEGHDWAVSELIVGRATGKPTFTVSRAIRDEHGELLGVVAASIEPDGLESVLGVVRSKDAGVSLIDNKGMHVYRYPPTTYTWEQRNWLTLYPILDESLKGSEVKAALQSRVTGKKRLAAFAPISSIGWVASCSRAENEVTAAIIKVLMPQVLLTLLLTLVAFGAAVGLSRPIIISILKLRDHAASLGRGEMGRIVLDGPRELTILANTLNEMADKIRLREATIRESESLYRTIAQNFPQGAIFIFDHDLRFRVADGKALAMLGYSREGLEGKTIWEATDEKNCRILEERFPRVLSGESLYFEMSLNGNVFSSSYVPIRDAHGKVISGMVVSHDITERKKAEKALQQLNENLEQQVAERTAVAEARAKQLQALAVELIETEERERRQFAQLLHDDLQQMLAAAKMQLETVSARFPHESSLADVKNILMESIGKSRRLSHELSPPVLHHSGLVAALQWLGQRMGEQFGLEVQLETNLEQQHDYKIVKTFLFRAVQELLFNIVKHAGVKRAFIALSDSDNALTISVRDDGQGFDPDNLYNAASKAGFGLLSIRERASHIGGSLTIDSAPGRGSRFTLAVPLGVTNVHVDKEQHPAVDLKSRTSKMAEISASRSIRVLFADDHHIMRQGLIKLTIGQPDIQIVGEAATGKEALEIARNIRPHVVVMDVSMPEMDGIEATRRIKAELPEIRVIGLSMYEDEQIIRTMREVGAEAFVTKSVSAAELLKAIYGNTRKN
jgi:PAS domain S-box-containing protein